MNEVRPTLKGGYRGGKRRCKANLRRVQPRGEEVTTKRKETEKEGISKVGRESGRGLFFAKQQPASQLTWLPPPSMFFLHSLSLLCLAHTLILKFWSCNTTIKKVNIFMQWYHAKLSVCSFTHISNHHAVKPYAPQHRHTLNSRCWPSSFTTPLFLAHSHTAASRILTYCSFVRVLHKAKCDQMRGVQVCSRLAVGLFSRKTLKHTHKEKKINSCVHSSCHCHRELWKHELKDAFAIATYECCVKGCLGNWKTTRQNPFSKEWG